MNITYINDFAIKYPLLIYKYYQRKGIPNHQWVINKTYETLKNGLKIEMQLARLVVGNKP